jgi:hypothetical protein
MFCLWTIGYSLKDKNMNKRIQALAEQSGAFFLPPSQDYFGEWFAGGLVIRDMDVEKFAQLMVKECQFAIVSRTDLPAHERKLYNNVLKEYFGVE